MNISGELTKTDNGSFVGWIGSLTFDTDVVLSENPHKAKDTHPDYQITAKTPRDREIRVGSAWERVSKAGNDYLSLSIDVGGATVNANALFDEDSRTYHIKAFAS